MLGKYFPDFLTAFPEAFHTVFHSVVDYVERDFRCHLVPWSVSRFVILSNCVDRCLSETSFHSVTSSLTEPDNNEQFKLTGGDFLT